MKNDPIIIIVIGIAINIMRITVIVSEQKNNVASFLSTL